MRRIESFHPHARAVVCIALALTSFGCPSSAPRSNVEYGSGMQIGTWQLGGAGGSGSSIGAAGDGSTIAPPAGNGAGGTPAMAGIGGSSTAGIGGAAGDGSFAGVGGGGATAGIGGVTIVPSSITSLTFDVLTHAQGGNYQPKNIGAIWVETATGQFVKTLEVWAFIRASHLTKWNNETGGNRVDAVSSATLSSHKAHHVTWDVKDASGNPVPAGAYKLIVECTDRNSPPGKFVSIDFTLDAPATITPPDQQHYTAMQLVTQ